MTQKKSFNVFKMLFLVLLASLVGYGLYFGYRYYKKKIDKTFVDSVLVLNKSIYEKIDKVGNYKYKCAGDISEVKNSLKKLNKKDDKKEDKKEETQEINDNEKKKEIEKLEGKLKLYDEISSKLNKVLDVLLEKEVLIHGNIKKCQLGFISNKVKNEVQKFVNEYIEGESSLDKEVENVCKEYDNIKEQEKKEKEKQKKKEDEKKEDIILKFDKNDNEDEVKGEENEEVKNDEEKKNDVEKK